MGGRMGLRALRMMCRVRLGRRMLNPILRIIHISRLRGGRFIRWLRGMVGGAGIRRGFVLVKMLPRQRRGRSGGIAHQFAGIFPILPIGTGRPCAHFGD